ncbi:probable LRR receptor-like serine/threonine-protein kinase At5g48740 [Cucurbita moschata]|uniref:Probable LRR receptor-like serine/threonine-protein kinase At5g48740 n=1 Tax=Cucurbita moschata TaxID=3662 RepID=A0A6J1H749_CUCMO|nr:probable LRR receptor-like serine/threonine-protein kinase At5g48740 [Cucurbita moschata]
MDLQLLWVGFFLCCGFWTLALSDQDVFLSLSCGGTTTFTDSSNISWIPDIDYIGTGNTSIIDKGKGGSFSTGHVRFFPDTRARKCYKLPLKNGSSSVLIRAQFVYKNYDKLGKPPAFAVSIGTAITTNVNLTSHDPWTEEFVWPVNKETVSFCLHSIPEGGSPLISSVELRPLPRGAYDDGLLPNQALRKSYRINCGYTNGSLRYPIDRYDRIWDADENFKPFHVSSGFKVEANFDSIQVKEAPPAVVVETARVLARRDELSYNLPVEEQGDYFVILYFGGILAVHPSFDVLMNGKIIESNYTVEMGEMRALYVIQDQIKSLIITFKSVKFYPQVNAIEVYQIVHVPLEASSTTVSALQVIHQSIGLNLGWEDDPCSPRTWDHVGCEGNLVTSLELSDINFRSISPTFGDILDLKILDLHNTSLTGQIENLGSLTHLENLNLSYNKLTSFGTDFENLSNLKILDLQNNSLQGIVPDSLGELEDLHLLNLENNRLEGTLPLALNKGTLEIRTSGNPCLSFSTMTCNDVSSNPAIETPQVTVVPDRKKDMSSHNSNSHMPITVIACAVAAVLLVLITLSLSFLLYMRKHSQHTAQPTYSTKAAMELRNWNAAKVFSYKEIKAATNNFKEVIGRGSFGSVYLGKLPEGKLVAVKVRFDKSQLGADSFINEVHLLSQIRHQNLVCLEGFCNESKRQILVYEYLPGGSLADHIYGKNKKSVSLSWIRRLKVAVDAAKGLDYLHNGSEPRIIHRDVKCSNILLDMEMNAKVCDFGLSKQLPQPDATHVTTVVKGTAGYLDPEYYSTQQLTEKSDVYSFGVVLLELICGREPLSHTGNPDSFNLVLWAKPYLQAGAFEIVDERLRGRFDVESMKKAAVIAISCVERDASLRPNIGQVLDDLKQAYDAQIAYLSTFGL